MNIIHFTINNYAEYLGLRHLYLHTGKLSHDSKIPF